MCTLRTLFSIWLCLLFTISNFSNFKFEIKFAQIGCGYKNSMRGKYEKPNAIRRLVAQTTRKVNPIWDVEDLVEALKHSTPSLCPYFSSGRVLIDDADIIFCPFSYLIGRYIFCHMKITHWCFGKVQKNSRKYFRVIFSDPIIRANSGVSLKNTVVILDEAHNVEDVCREAVSFTFMERELVGAAADLYQKGLRICNLGKGFLVFLGTFISSKIIFSSRTWERIC